jgi:hypothetical protein
MRCSSVCLLGPVVQMAGSLPGLSAAAACGTAAGPVGRHGVLNNCFKAAAALQTAGGRQPGQAAGARQHRKPFSSHSVDSCDPCSISDSFFPHKLHCTT